MSSKTSLLVCTFFILQYFFAFSWAQICGSTGNYTSGSTYETNLITLLSTLSTNVDQYGFYNASLGLSPNRVNAIVMCRADIQLDLCQFCVQNSTIELVRTCPNQRQAIWWYPRCMVRYSDAPIFGTLSLLPGSDRWSSQNVTSPVQFLADLSTLLSSLQRTASDSLHKAASGNIDSADLQTIYAFVQCTPDISSTDCNACLNSGIQEMANCCSASRLVEIFSPSCNIIYNYQPFVDETRMQELEQAGPTPPLISISPPMRTPPLLTPPTRGPPLFTPPTLTPPLSELPGLTRPLPFPPPLSSSPGNVNDFTDRIIMIVVLAACLFLA